MTASNCPTRTQLAAFSLGKLSALTLDSVAAHVEDCPSCQAALDELGAAESDSLVSGLRQPLSATLHQEKRPAAGNGEGAPALPDSVAGWVGMLRDGGLLTPAQLRELQQAQGQYEQPSSLLEDLVRRGWLTSFQVSQLVQGRVRELVQGPYVILDRLGQGGMGVVYKARQTDPERVVALKRLRAGTWAGDEELLRFRNEAAAVARLQHEHIVKLFEAGQHEGQPFFTMEYLDGGSLAQKVAGTPQPFREAAQLVQILAHAVAHAHTHGIVHRDLKPANVLLTAKTPRTPRGEALSGLGDLGALAVHSPKIADFGLAKLLGGPSGLTQTGQILGTPSYMAPEQTTEDGKRVGPAVDVYALGAILYELLTGRPPFRGESAWETLQQVQRQEPVGPRLLRPGLPRDLETICLKCLQKEPGRRYVTAEALADDLGLFLEDRPIRARPAGPVERAWRWCRRNPARAGLAAAVFLVALTSVGLVIAAGYNSRLRGAYEETETQRGEAMNQRNRAEGLLASARYVQDVNSAYRSWREGDLPGMRSFLNQQPGDQTPDFRDFAWRYLDRLARGKDLVTLKGHRGLIRSVAFTPDGKTLITGSKDGSVKLWERATRQELRTLRPATGSSPVTQLAVSADGGLLAVGYEDGKVRVWQSPDGGLPETLVADGQESEPKDLAVWVSFAPQGRLLATAGKQLGVRLWDLGSGKAARTPRAVADRGGGPLWSQALCFSPDGRTLATVYGSDLLRLVDPATGQETARHVLNMQGAQALAFSPDGKWLAVGGRGGTALFDPAAGQVVRYLHGQPTSQAQAVQFAPDGKTLAVATDSYVGLWDVDTGLGQASLRGHEYGVWCLAYSPDGRAMLTGGLQGEVILWDLTRPREAEFLPGLTTVTHCLAFTPDGKSLIVGGGQRSIPGYRGLAPGELVVCDVHTGRARFLQAPRPEIPAVAFAPDGKTLAAALSRTALRMPGQLGLYDAETGKPVRVLADFPGPVTAVAYAPDGRLLAVASGDPWDPAPRGEVRLYETGTGQPSAVLQAGCRVVGPLAFSPDGKTLAGVCTDLSEQAVVLWDVTARRVQARFGKQPLQVRALAYSPDGKTLALGCGTQLELPGEVRLLRVETGEVRPLPRVHNRYVTSVAFAPDGKRLAAGSWDATVRMWHVDAGQWSSPLPAQGMHVVSLAFAPDGRTLAVSGQGFPDRKAGLKLWDLASAREIGGFEPQSDWPQCLAMAPDGKRLATGSDDGHLRLWSVGRGRQPEVLPVAQLPVAGGHGGAILSAAVSGAGRVLATGGEDRTVRLWDLATGKVLETLPEHPRAVEFVALSPDGDTLFTGCADGKVWLWDLHPTRLRAEVPLGLPAVAAFALSPDGRRFACAGKGEVAVFDRAGGEAVARFRQKEFVTRLVFADGGQSLVTGGQLGKLTLWDVDAGTVRATWKGHNGGVRSLALSPEGRTLASVGDDNQLRLWQASSGQELVALELPQGRPLSLALAFAPDGGTLALGGLSRGTCLLRAGTEPPSQKP